MKKEDILKQKNGEALILVNTLKKLKKNENLNYQQKFTKQKQNYKQYVFITIQKKFMIIYLEVIYR